ncbi:MAG: MFS transporter, partial [Chloroflexota bacterium]
IMAIGTAFYAVGFGMFGFIQGVAFFALAMVILTIGEMLIAPIGQTLVAKFAPEDMRGRYMAVFGFSWGIPNLFIPYLAGVVMDNYNPNWIWYASLVVGSISALGYYYLHAQAKDRLQGDDAVEPIDPQAAVTA